MYIDVYQNASAGERFLLRWLLVALAFPLGMLVMWIQS